MIIDVKLVNHKQVMSKIHLTAKRLSNAQIEGTRKTVDGMAKAARTVLSDATSTSPWSTGTLLKSIRTNTGSSAARQTLFYVVCGWPGSYAPYVEFGHRNFPGYHFMGQALEYGREILRPTIMREISRNLK